MPNPHQQLIHSLRQPGLLAADGQAVELLETHISWILLTRDHAFKIKKPVNLGFLDFSTLEKRKHFCEQELRLNRRFAPQLYQGVVTIGGTPESPHLDDLGAPLEYAVRMRRFPADALMDQLLDRGGVTAEMIDQIGQRTAALHASAPVAPADSDFGTPEQVWHPLAQGFAQLKALLGSDHPEHTRLTETCAWSERQYTALRSILAQRKASGRVRECHGDMHLGNLVALESGITPFDALEFDPALRWIDPMSEIAFLIMDLDHRAQPRLARRFLNHYLEQSGDYTGLSLLPFYLVYRATVRAKINAIRQRQPQLAPEEAVASAAQPHSYLALAQSYTRPPLPFLAITHGPSASGKSKAAMALVEGLGVLRIRSDVERKRLAGLTPLEQSASQPGQGLYSEDMTQQTYRRLEQLARSAIDAGFSVVIDATFLERERRRQFMQLANTLKAPFIILSCMAPQGALRERLARRQNAAANVSEATPEVLARQLRNQSPLTPEEQVLTIRLDTNQPYSAQTIVSEAEAKLAALVDVVDKGK